MSATAGPLEFRQRYADTIETIETHLDGRQAQIHTALPGHIVSYDPATMSASVQIAVQAIQQNIDGTAQAVTILPISDVPVHFPSGGGHTMTFPIQPGDECLLIFSERNIDNWFAGGGVQHPGDYRMHDINDAFVLVGARSQPKVLQNVDPNTVQLRSDDKKTFVQVDGKNQGITLYATNGGDDSSVFVDGAGSNVTIKCATEIKLDCPKITVNGSIFCAAEVIAQAQTMGYVTLSGHLKHSGSPSQPTPGT